MARLPAIVVSPVPTTPEDDAAAAIAAAIQGPASASGDAGSVTQHNLKDLMAAADWIAGNAAAKRPGSGISWGRFRPGGTV